MGRTGDGARLMLEPYGSGVRPFRAIDADHSGRSPPFVAWAIGSLFPAEHNHIADAVGPREGLRPVDDRLPDPTAAVQVHEVLSALGPHLRFAPEGRRRVQLGTKGTKLAKFFFLKHGPGDSGGTPKYPLGRTKPSCLHLLVFGEVIDLAEFLHRGFAYDG